ncbi:MAG: pyridoxal-phosphate dependent enzyme [Alphaproteobacteria bacterium]|nr:pyridoxal-phosphate dependent enzyme [Alphaproteobacteria bacterium]MCY4318541.1 pyridoxal-phosphate dependent enzyme [Alphaproteobacteria bacterium]
MTAAYYINPRSGASWPANQALWCAPDDGGLLELTPGKGLGPDEIERSDLSLWRYRAAIRVEDKSRVSLGEGFTPLVETEWGGRRLLFKCEHLMPTGSFKDRGAAVMMSHLKQTGVAALLEDSSGNAGASIAAYAAAADLHACIMAPAGAPVAKRVQIAAVGAELQKLPGDRDAVGRAALAAAEERFYASHNRQPFFLEGIRTLAFELWEQLGFRAPAAVAAPCGNGANILGLYLGFRELQMAGQIAALPRLHAVQAANNAPIRALFDGRVRAQGPTIADGIATAQPIRGRMVADAVKATGGTVPVVSEEAILDALGRLARSGWFLEPTSAVVAAALPQIPEDDNLVLVLTGSGLKTLDIHAELAGLSGT